jgi:hypothetical protein
MPDDTAGETQRIHAALGVLFGLALSAAGILAAVWLANGVRTCGDNGEACMGPAIEYVVLGVPAYLLGVAAAARMAADVIGSAGLGRGAAIAVVAAGIGGLYALTFVWAAHT